MLLTQSCLREGQEGGGGSVGERIVGLRTGRGGVTDGGREGERERGRHGETELWRMSHRDVVKQKNV